jgi:hypothetical protein
MRNAMVEWLVQRAAAQRGVPSVAWKTSPSTPPTGPPPGGLVVCGGDPAEPWFATSAGLGGAAGAAAGCSGLAGAADGAEKGTLFQGFANTGATGGGGIGNG